MLGRLDPKLMYQAQEPAIQGGVLLAVAVKEDSPWNLQRLVDANLLKGNRAVADKYLNLLDRTLWFRRRARDRRKYLADTLPAQSHTSPFLEVL